MTLKFFFNAMETYIVIYWIYVFIAFLPLLMHCCSIFHCIFLTGYTWVKATQILFRFFVFLILVMSLIMQITPGKWDLSLLWKARSSLNWWSPIHFLLLADVRPGFCFSMLSNGRCGNQLPQPLSKMQCCCDSGRCWASTAASAPEMCPIRSTGMNPPELSSACWNTELAVVSFICVFSRNVFMELHRMVEAGGHLDRLFRPSPLFKQSLLGKRSHAQDF